MVVKSQNPTTKTLSKEWVENQPEFPKGLPIYVVMETDHEGKSRPIWFSSPKEIEEYLGKMPVSYGKITTTSSGNIDHDYINR